MNGRRVYDPQSIGPDWDDASVTTPSPADSHHREPERPPISRPEPETSGPRRGPQGWTRSAPVEEREPVGMAYRVAQEYLDEGRRGAERWMPALSGRGPGLESIADAIVQLNQWSQHLQSLLTTMMPNVPVSTAPQRTSAPRHEPAQTQWRERQPIDPQPPSPRSQSQSAAGQSSAPARQTFRPSGNLTRPTRLEPQAPLRGLVENDAAPSAISELWSPDHALFNRG